MGELVLVQVADGRCAIWRDEILSLAEAGNLRPLPFASPSIAALCSVGERMLTLVDLHACLGFPPAAGQGAWALVMSQSGRSAGFLARGPLTVISSSRDDVRPLPSCISTAVVDSCMLLDSRPVPIVNLGILYGLMFSGKTAPSIEWRAPSGPRASAHATPPTLRIVRADGILFALSGPDGFGVTTDVRSICPLPRAPAWVAGAAVLDGVPVPVIDLARRVGLAPRGRPSVIVQARLGSSAFGLLVEEDQGDRSTGGIRWCELPPLLRTPCMGAVALHSGGMVPILDLEKVLSAAGTDNGGRVEPRYLPGSPFGAAFGREDCDVVEFSLLGARHALPKCEVKDILPWTPCHAIPFAPPIAVGALELGDEVLPVIDLAAAFGAAASPSHGWRMLLVENGDFRGLVLSETVLGDRRLERVAQRPIPIVLPFPLVYGCYANGNSVSLILNVEEVAVHFGPSVARHFQPASTGGPAEVWPVEEREALPAQDQEPRPAVEQEPRPVEEQAPRPAEVPEPLPVDEQEALPAQDQAARPAGSEEESEETAASVGEDAAAGAPAEAAGAGVAAVVGEEVTAIVGAEVVAAQAAQGDASIELVVPEEAAWPFEAVEGQPKETSVEILLAADEPPLSVELSLDDLPAEAVPAAPLAETALPALTAEVLPLESPLLVELTIGEAEETAGKAPRAADRVPSPEPVRAPSLVADQVPSPEADQVPSPEAGETSPASSAEPAGVSISMPPQDRAQGKPRGKGRKRVLLAAAAVLCVGVVLGLLFVTRVIPRLPAGGSGTRPSPPVSEPAHATQEPMLELSLPPESTIEPFDYAVVEGDTLWSIAERFTGNPFNYPHIAGESGIADPDLIFPGQLIRLTREKAPAPQATR